MRLSRKKVIELLRENEALTISQLCELTGAKYYSMQKMIKRMEKDGIVMSLGYDWTGGKKYEKYFSLAPKQGVDPNTVLKEVFEWMRKKDHRYLASLPKSVGGKQTKGSGWLSSWRALIEVLQEMDYI